MSEHAAWVALSLLRHVGSRTLDALIATFGSAQAVLQADAEHLKEVSGVGAKIAAAIVAIDLQQTQQALAAWQQAGVLIVTRHDDHYPTPLHTIPDPPPTLFVRGNYAPDQWQRTVALVGTRKPSQQGGALAHSIASKLSADGWTVVSGLALGIDAAAHRGALAGSDGSHVAVLGGGVLAVYPPQNRMLAERLCENGALISENHPYATSNAPRLVTRNRIISGLAQHIIIVESDTNGGAMYAAEAARKQGRHLHTLDLPASGNRALIDAGTPILDPLRLTLS